MKQQFRKVLDCLCLLCAGLLLLGIAIASPFAYVSNEQSGTVSVINTTNDSVVADIKAGSKPRGFAIAGKRLCVSEQIDNALVVIDLDSRMASSTVALGESPEGVSASADGDWNAAAREGSNAVSFINVATGQKVFSVTTQGKNLARAVFSPDGKLLLVSAEEADTVDIVNVTQRKQMASIRVGMRPRGIAFRPDGALAYVACELANTVCVIDVPGRRVIQEIRAGNFSNGVTMVPDGKRVYVSNGRDNSVSVIDTAAA